MQIGAKIRNSVLKVRNSSCILNLEQEKIWRRGCGLKIGSKNWKISKQVFRNKFSSSKFDTRGLKIRCKCKKNIYVRQALFLAFEFMFSTSLIVFEGCFLIRISGIAFGGSSGSTDALELPSFLYCFGYS